MTKRIAYLDMDGVIADFEKGMKIAGVEDASEYKLMFGAYRHLPVMPLAHLLMQALREEGFELRILTKPPTHNPYAATEKLEWIADHFPELLEHVTITHDKGQVGTRNDILIDDRPHKANCTGFRGLLVVWYPDSTINYVLDHIHAN